MLQIYQNQGMVEEETYASLELVPPISIIAPWCFQVTFFIVIFLYVYYILSNEVS